MSKPTSAPSAPSATPAPIYGEQALLNLLDELLARRGSEWWDGFYADRAKPCGFFGEAPDESLAQWVAQRALPAGHGQRALDLGCGNGRNAIHLARHGYQVDGVDYSPAAIAWATDRAQQAGVAASVRWHACSVFEMARAPGRYELAYDSGCFHHLPPHRRHSYVQGVAAALKPGGWLGLTCFRPEGGSGLTDAQVYEGWSLGGGLGYTEEALCDIWSHEFEVHSVRRMNKPADKPADGSGLFGEDFLSVLWARKRA